jgi:hypothetical protein
MESPDITITSRYIDRLERPKYKYKGCIHSQHCSDNEQLGDAVGLTYVNYLPKRCVAGNPESGNDHADRELGEHEIGPNLLV